MLTPSSPSANTLDVPAHSAYRHRRLAVRVSLFFAAICATFGAFQTLLYEPVNAAELWRPEYARLSELTNYLSSLLALTFAWFAHNLPKLGQRALPLYNTGIRLTMLGTLALSLTHIHVGGAHSSLVGLVLLIQMVTTRWFVPHSDVPWFYTLTACATVTVLYLEYREILPYAPMFVEPPSTRIFLDWRFVVGDVVLYTSLATPVLLLVGRARVAFEEREDDLEMRVRDRTARLETEMETARSLLDALQAEESLRRSAEANREQLRVELQVTQRAALIGEIAGSVAHELNQPLFGILANTEAALELLGRTPPAVNAARAALEDIADDERRAEDIIRAVRRLASGDLNSTETVNLAKVVNDTLQILARTADDASVTLVRGETASAEVPGSRIQWAQLVSNVVRNAIQASEPGGSVTISVRLEAGSALLEVVDQGCGFTEQALRHAFDPWMTTRPGGMGLGLALSRRISEAYGAAISARNNDVGATVSVRIPLAELSGNQESP